MALTATLHHFEIALSDSDRGVYQSLDLRVARHPSETMRYMLTRVLGYCLLWEDGIAFSKGLSTTDEPAVWLHEPDGRVRLWVEVGHPSAARLHKASKNAGRVVICTQEEPTSLQRALQGERIHHAEQIEIIAFEPVLLDALGEIIERRMRWELVVTGGHLYVTSGGKTYDGAATRTPLVAA